MGDQGCCADTWWADGATQASARGVLNQVVPHIGKFMCHVGFNHSPDEKTRIRHASKNQKASLK
jgi:hypothetical protein